MKYRFKYISSNLLWVGMVLLVNSTVWGIVLHTDDEPADKPSDALVGFWNTFASCVVISPNHVISTRHQDHAGGPNTVTIMGTDYKVADDLSIADDIRISRITTADGQLANLSEYAEIYTRINISGKTFAIGGYGMVRGAELRTVPGNILYGYSWASNPGNQLHWGKNKVAFYGTDWIAGTFDGPGEGDYILYEAIPAWFDSGGGWFIEEGGLWKLAGISHGVEHVGQALFRDPVDPADPNADGFDCWRLRNYAATIANAIAPPAIPVNVVATAVTGIMGEVNLSWDTVVGADGYRVYYSEDLPGPDFTPLGSDVVGSTTTTVTNLMPANTYYFAVTAYSGIAESNYSVQDWVEIAVVEDFDDDMRGAMWRLYGDCNSVHVSEESGHLELLASGGGGELEAMYGSNGWGLEPMEDFELKVDFHHELSSGPESDVFLRIGPNADNYISFSAGSDFGGKYFQYKEVTGGSVNSELQMVRGVNDGTLYISYDTITDQLYLSDVGYGSGAAWQTIPGVLAGQWSGEVVYVSTGGSGNGASVSSGQVYLDNLMVNNGELVDWPVKSDIDGDGFIGFGDVYVIGEQWLDIGGSLGADINGDGDVNFMDFAELAKGW